MRGARKGSIWFERGESKLALGLRGRVHALPHLLEWAQVYRDPARPLLWLHAPSVGEGLQARIVLDRLLAMRPELQVAYTFFSPSALELARSLPVHVAGYLPWDVRGEMLALVRSLLPSLLVFTKTEVWPGLTAAARSQGVPVALAAATLPSGAGRLRFPARRILRPAFSSLDRVLAISEEDAGRFGALGVRRERIEVSGDPAIDSAWERARGADLRSLALAPFLAEARPTLVAGSTWEPDEALLLPALLRLRERNPTLRLILAPHEPREGVLLRLEAEMDRLGLSHLRLREVESHGEIGARAVILVDRVGLLAHLYRVGTIAYVGGGFGRRGLHSVLEPAAAGLPVLHGPHHGNSRAAGDLLRDGGGRIVHGVDELVELLTTWLRDRRLLEGAGRAAAGYIEGHRGAAGFTAERLLEFIGPPSGRSS